MENGVKAIDAQKAAQMLEVDETTIYAWVRKNWVNSFKADGKVWLLAFEVNSMISNKKASGHQRYFQKGKPLFKWDKVPSNQKPSSEEVIPVTALVVHKLSKSERNEVAKTAKRLYYQNDRTSALILTMALIEEESA